MSSKFLAALAVLVGTTIGAGFLGIPYVVSKSGFLPGIAIMIFVIHWKLALLVFALVPLISIPIVYIGRRLRNLSKQSQEKMADINSLLIETISGVRIVRAFSMEEYELDKFKKGNEEINVNAREVTRKLEKLTAEGITSEGIEINGGGRLFFGLLGEKNVVEEGYADPVLISCAKTLDDGDLPASLVTKDLNLRVRARLEGVLAVM